jgi:hypothetical protein
MFLRVGVCMKLSKDPWLDAYPARFGIFSVSSNYLP